MSILWMKIVASVTTGTANTTFKVPGIKSSEMDFVNFHADVAIAKLPIPNVSKKLAIRLTTELATTVVPFSLFTSPLCAIMSLTNMTRNITV